MGWTGCFRGVEVLDGISGRLVPFVHVEVSTHGTDGNSKDQRTFLRLKVTVPGGTLPSFYLQLY